MQAETDQAHWDDWEDQKAEAQGERESTSRAKESREKRLSETQEGREHCLGEHQYRERVVGLTQAGNLLWLVRGLAQLEQTRFWAARSKSGVVWRLRDRGLPISGRHRGLVPVHCRRESAEELDQREKAEDIEEEKGWLANWEKQRQNHKRKLIIFSLPNYLLALYLTIGIYLYRD